MQYSVPQFLNIEDKIVGPFTGKQVLFLIMGFGVLLISFTFFNMAFFAIIAILVIPITLAFAFWKPKGMTVSRLITNMINFHTTSHLYVWRREPNLRMYKMTQRKVAKDSIGEKKVSKRRIRELAWLLDTSTSIDTPFEAKTRPDENI
ncbi:MAG: PrgI family protein [Candidatus Pacebacteria bacterium]|nr:PrgI family protein [Candidatus Paceibacterota bacterium]